MAGTNNLELPTNASEEMNCGFYLFASHQFGNFYVKIKP